MVASNMAGPVRRAQRSLTLKYLKRRLKRLERRVQSPRVTETDVVQCERVAAQLEEAKRFLH